MQKSIIFQENTLYYSIEGVGKPVVLIHGFGETALIWQNTAFYFKNNYQIIIPELPGCGKSAIINDITMENVANFIAMILQNEEIDRCIIIGHSMGGYIALAFAQQYPEMLNGLGLYHSTAFADTEEKKNTRKKGIEFIKKSGAYPFIENTSPGLFSNGFKEKNKDAIDQYINTNLSINGETLINYYHAMMQRTDKTNVLKEAAYPILFIIGEHDMAVPKTDSLMQSHMPSLSYIYIMRSSGHMAMIEEPEKSNLMIKEFLYSI